MKDKLESVLDGKISVGGNKNAISEVWVYGSVLTGDFSERSDIDVYCVIPEENEHEVEGVAGAPEGTTIEIDGTVFQDVKVDAKKGSKSRLENYADKSDKLQISTDVL